MLNISQVASALTQLHNISYHQTLMFTTLAIPIHGLILNISNIQSFAVHTGFYPNVGGF